MAVYTVNPNLIRNQDLSGRTFGRLTVQSFLCSHKHNRRWLCKCACGNIVTLSTRDLFRINSCGCLLHDNPGSVKTTPDGHASTHQLKLQYIIDAKKRKYGKHGVSDEILYNGIDRLENTIGYEDSNCVPACKICNFAKRNLSQKQFYDWIKRLVNFQKDKINDWN